MIMPKGEPGRGVEPLTLLMNLNTAKAIEIRAGSPEFLLSQVWYYEAINAENDGELFATLARSLEINPGNADSLLYLLRCCEVGDAERLEMSRTIVRMAEAQLGKAEIEAKAPYLWEEVAARPYLRARAMLAAVSRNSGDLAAAIAEYRALWALNTNDQQGVRFDLLPLLLEIDRPGEAQNLLDQFPGEEHVVFAWGKVLLCLLAAGEDEARAALAAARKYNPHMEKYLLDDEVLPTELPPHYDPGTEDEARCYADALAPAWDAHEAALDWLEEN